MKLLILLLYFYIILHCFNILFNVDLAFSSYLITSYKNNFFLYYKFDFVIIIYLFEFFNL